MEKSWLIAHRGGALEAFENSPQAFRHALSSPCRSIEVDLRVTRDQEIVILHDATLNRTTTGRGRLKNYNLSELQSFTLKNGEKIPTLRELLSWVDGKKFLHLEIKETGFEEKLLKTLETFYSLEKVYLISFYPEILERIHRLNFKVRTGFGFSMPSSLTRCPRFCEVLLPDAKRLTPKFLRTLLATQKKIHAWTVNDSRQAKKLMDSGVHGIITDQPSMLEK